MLDVHVPIDVNVYGAAAETSKEECNTNFLLHSAIAMSRECGSVVSSIQADSPYEMEHSEHSISNDTFFAGSSFLE